MSTVLPTTISILAGIAIGAGAVQCLYARAKPPAYVITDADVTNLDAYINDYLPLVKKAFVAGGGKYLVRNGKVVAFDGEPPKRIAILAFENLDKAQAALTSAAFKDARAVGQEHATFRTFAVENFRSTVMFAFGGIANVAGESRDVRQCSLSPLMTQSGHFNRL